MRSTARRTLDGQRETASARFLAAGIARHATCNVEIADWPYECIAKDKHPDHTVYVCRDHGAWWHRSEEIAFEKPRYRCRCSASGSQGACGHTTQTAEGMRAHYAARHHWTVDLDTVRATEMRYRELAAES